MKPNQDVDSDIGSMFQEPNDYFIPEKPATYAQHSLLSGQTIKLRLVGHSPLWGHLLWNAGQVVSEYLQYYSDSLIRDKCILELGAGAGLPSLVCAILGARNVVVTDYPDQDLIENLEYNIANCHTLSTIQNISAEGYLWGSPSEKLLAHLDTSKPIGFDTLILADVLFNHSEHEKLVSSVQQTLRKTADATALVFFTPYRPWLIEKDLAFFDGAKASGFSVEKVLEKNMEKVMFEDDPGDESLRRTVFGYLLRWEHLAS